MAMNQLSEIKDFLGQIETSRVAPAEDFEKVLQREFAFIQGLKKLIKLQVEHAENLLKEDGEKTTYQQLKIAEMEYQINLNQEKLALHHKLLKDKIEHWETHFVPAYESRLEYTKLHWDTTFAEAKDLLKKDITGATIAFLQRLVDDFDAESPLNQKNIEVRAQYLPEIDHLVKKLKQLPSA